MTDFENGDQPTLRASELRGGLTLEEATANSHRYFPLRASPLPTLHQVLSEPDLRSRHLGVGEGYSDDKDPNGHFDELLADLDHTGAKRRRAQNALRQVHRAKVQAEKQEQILLEEMRGQRPTRPAWVTQMALPALFMEPGSQRFEGEDDVKGAINRFNGGIYAEAGLKSPHSMKDASAWCTAHTLNWRGESLAIFGAKPRSQLNAGEIKFQERLERVLAKARVAELKARKREDAKGPRAADLRLRNLSRTRAPGEKPPWTSQAVSTHEVFENSKPLTPGQFVARKDMVLGPERSFNTELGMICGTGEKDRQSHWQPPKAGQKKLTRLQQETRDLLEPPGVRKQRLGNLAGTGSTKSMSPKADNKLGTEGGSTGKLPELRVSISMPPPSRLASSYSRKE